MMTNVAISNRSLLNQKVSSLENNKVFLPFNVNKEQAKKLSDLLSKTKISFLFELDNLKIKNKNLVLNNCRFTLSKTYVVTMKQNFITKMKTFYNRLVEEKIVERPIFNIARETNLQEALQEATTEIDLSMINAGLNNLSPQAVTIPEQFIQVQEQPQSAQVLANNPLGETIIENPINLNMEQQPKISTSTIENNMVNVNPVNQMNNPSLTNVNIPVGESTVINQEAINSVENTVQQPKKKKRLLRGNILSISVVAIWLGLVFFGTLKLVTYILTK